ncbi:hypothetical protein KC19_10G059000 [Ceratodon purpureus]|uniref:Secreted protein n=1 Tax=Ceratodon purpureus TaxID=3225 RepID=A0A8T0GIL5_CERPU|nr:hypothetical protein KC19_10G059000 [Ceratodon purpureus]
MQPLRGTSGGFRQVALLLAALLRCQVDGLYCTGSVSLGGLPPWRFCKIPFLFIFIILDRNSGPNKGQREYSVCSFG